MQDPTFRAFRAEHRRVLEQVRSMKQAVSRRLRGRLGPTAEIRVRAAAGALARQFATHMSAEEDVLYPVLASSLPEGTTRFGVLRGEHGDLRSMLGRLRELLGEDAAPARDEQIVVQVRDFAELLELHIRKEEAAVFGLASRVLEPRELERLASQVAEHRDRLARGPVASRTEKGTPS